MSEIIFARTRHIYDSYQDFWTLVELSGYKTCFVDEMDFQSNNLYITSPMNGDYREHLKNHPQRKCKLALWMLERPGGQNIRQFHSANNELVKDGLVDVIISSDPRMAREGSYLYVPMGSHPGLCEKQPDKVKRYDTIGLMAYTGRRAFLFSNPTFPKERLAPGLTQASNAWGAKRADLLAASKFMINVHQDQSSYCEPLRFALAAAYRLPIISENHSNPIYDSFSTYTTIDRFIALCQWAVSRYNSMFKEYGERFYQSFCIDNTFRSLLEKVL